MSQTNDAPRLEFKEDRPFHDMVAAFLAATMGLGNVFDPNNPSKFSPNVRSLYQGKHIPFLSIDQEQVHRMALKLSADRAVAMLCRMLANAAYEAVDGLPPTPEAEFFRHVRNAASHDNKFFFTSREPRRAASWKNCPRHCVEGHREPALRRDVLPRHARPG